MTTGQDAGGKQDPAMEDREALDLAARRRGRFLLFLCLLVAAVLGANILYGTVVFTRENRSYCLECHRVSGPELMWEASDRHAKGLTCGQCHGMLPGRKGRCGAFSAHAETVNPNCMGCHSSVVDGRPLNKIVEVRLQDGSKIYRWQLEQLMYGWHLKKKICLCTDCHRNISHERESTAFDHQPKMSYCKACHYHAVKDDYVRVSPLPMLEIREGERAKAKGERGKP